MSSKPLPKASSVQARFCTMTTSTASWTIEQEDQCLLASPVQKAFRNDMPSGFERCASAFVRCTLSNTSKLWLRERIQSFIVRRIGESHTSQTICCLFDAMTFLIYLLTLYLNVLIIYGRLPFKGAPAYAEFRPSSSSSLSGDMLNITKCYCMLESSKHFDQHAMAGHYYQWIYYNFHTDTWFNLTQRCRTNESHLSRPPKRHLLHKISDCLSYWRDNQGTPQCAVNTMGDFFCTTLDWKDGDRITLNGQQRQKESDKQLAPEADVTKVCDQLCSYLGSSEQVRREGKMEMIKGQVRKELNDHIDEDPDMRWSFIDSDYAFDDMCPDCE